MFNQSVKASLKECTVTTGREGGGGDLQNKIKISFYQRREWLLLRKIFQTRFTKTSQAKYFVTLSMLLLQNATSHWSFLKSRFAWTLFWFTVANGHDGTTSVPGIFTCIRVHWYLVNWLLAGVTTPRKCFLASSSLSPKCHIRGSHTGLPIPAQP